MKPTILKPIFFFALVLQGMIFGCVPPQKTSLAFDDEKICIVSKSGVKECHDFKGKLLALKYEAGAYMLADLGEVPEKVGKGQKERLSDTSKNITFLLGDAGKVEVSMKSQKFRHVLSDRQFLLIHGLSNKKARVSTFEITENMAFLEAKDSLWATEEGIGLQPANCPPSFWYDKAVFAVGPQEDEPLTACFFKDGNSSGLGTMVVLEEIEGPLTWEEIMRLAYQPYVIRWYPWAQARLSASRCDLESCDAYLPEPVFADDPDWHFVCALPFRDLSFRDDQEGGFVFLLDTKQVLKINYKKQRFGLVVIHGPVESRLGIFFEDAHDDRSAHIEVLDDTECFGRRGDPKDK